MIGNILGILLMLVLSACFSGTEIAYASSSELRLRQAAARGGRREERAYWIYEHYSDALTTLLLGNNLVNTAASSMATVLVISLLGNGYAWVATLGVTILVLIFGEITPKLIAKSMPEKTAIVASTPLRGLMWVFNPIVRLMQAFMNRVARLWRKGHEPSPAVTEEEIEVILDTAEDEGAIDQSTTGLLQSALDFDDTLAYEVITPRVDMQALDIDDPIETIVEEALSSRHSRLPVYEESKDNIIGILHLSRFLKHLVDDPTPDIRGMLMPVCFVPHALPLPAVLRVMRQHRCHLVVVVDEFGGTLGILTMEDVLEELVGDIWDETDEIDATLSLLPDGRYEASGDLRVTDMLDALDKDDRDYAYESTTVGGWASEMLGETPNPGDHFDYDGLRVTVEAMRKRRVTRVSIGILEGARQEGA